jgi:hypothetical protein
MKRELKSKEGYDDDDEKIKDCVTGSAFCVFAGFVSFRVSLRSVFFLYSILHSQKARFKSEIKGNNHRGEVIVFRIMTVLIMNPLFCNLTRSTKKE